MRLLIVEDEIGLAEGLKAVLEKNGYSVDMVHDGRMGLEYSLSNIYDLILLDIMLPKMNGLNVLENIRKEKITAPVLLLTARSEVDDKIRGLDCGADDYLTKPFDTGELLARVRALTRRKSFILDNNLTFADITLNRNTQELLCNNSSIKLGQKEFQLIEILISNPNRIIPKETLIEKVWGFDDNAEYNNVEVYISFVRKKLTHLHTCVQIKATRGVGYSLEEIPLN
ncbi:MAG TPA: response regulator transcription factor [Mobilitalea sp.]|nr:response regulator transcription factor [Mobilitalea sp.]